MTGIEIEPALHRNRGDFSRRMVTGLAYASLVIALAGSKYSPVAGAQEANPDLPVTPVTEVIPVVPEIQTDQSSSAETETETIKARCLGKVATIVGTNNKDRIFGTRGSDVISGLGGNDEIHGKGGKDIICGNDGDDKLIGGSSRDVMSGGDGVDTLSGLSGRDELSGGLGVDLLIGSRGSDKLDGGRNGDELVGGTGRDKLDGQSGADWCREGERNASCETSRPLIRIPGITKKQGRGSTFTYQVFIESGLAVNGKEAGEEIDGILGDKRGWIRGGRVAFKRVSSNPGTRIVVATPGRVDAVCATVGLNTAGKVSCRAGETIMLNSDRWRYAVPHWPNNRKGRTNIRTYHQMLINHEMGHRIGRGHGFCSGSGNRAPVMQQQTKFLLGCKANPWPLEGEL